MKRTIILALVAFCFAACNNPSSPARTDMDTDSINVSPDTDNTGNMTDTTVTPVPVDSLR